MTENIKLHYDVDGSDFTMAGEASSDAKRVLKKIGIPQDAVRRVSIAMYEGEINMVIHADGGTADLEIGDHSVTITLVDHGPGIPDIELAMQEGWSTAPEEVRNLGFGAGMGLPNMKKYTDTFDLTSEVGVGTKVVMTVNF
ncbi:MAG TPA: ATP-binding protein [Oscillospiraceae bacterium]|nr:ATP-binding protein [Oscillospiraceae bacterium]HPF56917.1 ATP-binding protein [Clostridiales bacterium]HPK35287.1 ATP-binding protein [Oscillospiraceae bacterium]HPR76939.1 ATP-binding protein [Oscillospiraceae bacterium]